MLLMLVRALYRLYLVCAAAGLCTPLEADTARRAGTGPWARRGGDAAAGIALVQGRRFGQEDRAVVAAAALPGGGAGSELLYAGEGLRAMGCGGDVPAPSPPLVPHWRTPCRQQ
jgi:hypothetical protein